MFTNPPSPTRPTTFSGPGFTFNVGPYTDVLKSDIMSVTRAYLMQLQNDIRTALPGQTDKMSRYHLDDVLMRVNRALDPNRPIIEIAEKK